MYKYHFHSVIVLYKPITGVIMAPEIADKSNKKNIFAFFSAGKAKANYSIENHN